MKKLSRIFVLFLIVISSSCYAQQIVRTTNDAKKLEFNKNLFIGKSLKILLNEINPKIEMVSANPSNSNQIKLGYFIFRFTNFKTYDSLRIKQKKYPLQIEVFVKEPFDWNTKTKALNKFQWTKEDEKKYGNLTVLNIRVFGEN